ncbi:MAG: endonuclease III [Kiritimatiellae bacterium]|nr:endonuclease III [Kiritimatiellia bacterium]MDW8459370.1 endonuclease III [Verrucomicrobiota bacterium]
MTRQERARIVAQRLDEFFPNVEPPLPHVDPFRLLVAVILSAQCTDKRVNEVAPRLFAIADTPERMAALPLATIRRVIRPCGLAPSKSRAIRNSARLILERHGGRVPRTFEELEELPGVGHKTASVVMSQAFGVPAFPVDTHIHRLARRWRLTRGRNVAETERDLKALFPPEEWHKRHLQIIFYGRAYCTARGCDGSRCPICADLNRKR